MGWFETTAETVDFFDRFRSTKGSCYDSFLGVNYDTCHLAIEFESAVDAFAALREKNIRISKLHLSSALRLSPAPQNLKTLKGFEDDIYLHQVVAKSKDGSLLRYRDLPDALECAMSVMMKSGGCIFIFRFIIAQAINSMILGTTLMMFLLF